MSRANRLGRLGPLGRLHQPLCAPLLRVCLAPSAPPLARLASSAASGPSSGTSQSELDHFAQLADTWWDVEGPQRILHKMNLLRADYIRETFAKYGVPSGNGSATPSQPVPGYSLDLLPKQERDRLLAANSSAGGANLKVLDVGCGGGILAESLARMDDLTQSVLGIDLSADVLGAANAHKRIDPALDPKLQYKLANIDQVEGTYDMITMFEVLEHVDSPSHVMRCALDRLNPGGWIFLSTINRTPISYFTTIFVGEKLLRIVPDGTHTWSKYINEHELREWVDEQADAQFVRSDGCIFVPTMGWNLTPWNHTVGNYFMAIRKRD